LSYRGLKCPAREYSTAWRAVQILSAVPHTSFYLSHPSVTPQSPPLFSYDAIVVPVQ